MGTATSCQPFGQIGGMLQNVGTNLGSIQPATQRTKIERGGSFSLTFPPIDLRPERKEVLENGISVLVSVTRTTQVLATWTASATNIDGSASGEFLIDFDETVDISSLLIEQLAGPLDRR